MYRPSAYYTANLLSALSTYMIYPVIVCVLPWYFLQLRDHSFENLLTYIFVSVLLSMAGLTFGVMLSSMIGNPLIALIIQAAMCFLFGMGGGQIVHIGGDNPAGFMWFNRTLMYLSPFRYGAELILRCYLKGIPG